MNQGNTMQTRKRIKRPDSAVTLLEVMVVVAIIGMIAGIASLVVLDRLQRAKVSVAKTQISNFVHALGMFYLDNDYYPTTEQGLDALVAKPTTGRVPKDFPENGYIDSIPLDPWGHEHIYVSPGAERGFEIMSLGRDGLQGGEGFDADITDRDVSKTPAGE
jgi:general secretion pathway protein G